MLEEQDEDYNTTFICQTCEAVVVGRNKFKRHQASCRQRQESEYRRKRGRGRGTSAEGMQLLWTIGERGWTLGERSTANKHLLSLLG